METVCGKQTNKQPKVFTLKWISMSDEATEQIKIIIKIIIINILKLNLNNNLFNIIISITLSPAAALPQGTK